MAYLPHFRITPLLLGKAEEIAALRGRILAVDYPPAALAALQRDARIRICHASTALEGGPLTLDQARGLEDGNANPDSLPRAKREIANGFAAMRFVERRSRKPKVSVEDVLETHRLLAAGLTDPGEAGRYRQIAVRVGRYDPPPPETVPGLVSDLLEWWNKESQGLSPVLSAAILRYRFEAIHPFAEANGRVARAMALWELYRRGFDPRRIFPVDEFFGDDRQAYSRNLDEVRKEGEDLSEWLEYSAEGLRQTLGRVWVRATSLGADTGERLVLKPRQEEILTLLRDSGGAEPRLIWDSLGVTRQAANQLLRPLLAAGLVARIGGKKTGKYILNGPGRHAGNGRHGF